MEYCADAIIVKFLDRNGFYRFFTFEQYYEVSDSPKLIGKTNEFVSNIFTDKTNQKVIGYENSRFYSMSKIVTNEQLNLFSDIYSSPRVYLYTGLNNSDLNNDWLEVEVIGGDTIVKRRKQKNSKISLIIKLPEIFTQKMV